MTNVLLAPLTKKN